MEAAQPTKKKTIEHKSKAPTFDSAEMSAVPASALPQEDDLDVGMDSVFDSPELKNEQTDLQETHKRACASLDSAAEKRRAAMADRKARMSKSRFFKRRKA